MRIKVLTIAALAAGLAAGCQSTGQGQTASPTLVPSEVPVPAPRPAAPIVTIAPTAPTPAAPAEAAPAGPATEAGFQAWLADFRARAAAQGISEATLAAALDNASLEPEVIELDQDQPEFNRAVWDYLDRAVSQDRIGQGGGKAADHRRLLDDIEARYGVPGEIVVAVWGLESNYGGNFGTFHVIDALATLAYDGRRRDWAEQQLVAALRILDAGDIDRDSMIGSWAGAMGHTQFLPSVSSRTPSTTTATAAVISGARSPTCWPRPPSTCSPTAGAAASPGASRSCCRQASTTARPSCPPSAARGDLGEPRRARGRRQPRCRPSPRPR